MSQTNVKKSTNWVSILTIPLSLIVSIVIYMFVFGDPANFNADGSPKEHNFFALIYKGGVIVPILMTCFLTVFIIVIERLYTIFAAKGTTSMETFLQKVKTNLSNGEVNQAITECDKQKGSVANVVRAGLGKYSEMEKNTELETEQKVLAIQKEMEEATSLELPPFVCSITMNI